MGIDEVKVSVVIAAYNSEKYIREMLNSVTSQTLICIEIICVDDLSTDSTPGILNEYAAKDSRIKVLYHTKKTDGAAAARNMGIAQASGEYLAVLDADDYFEPDMLEKAYKKAKETEADIVLYDGWVFDERIHADKEADFILRKEYLPRGKDVFAPQENADQLFLMTCGAAWNGLYRREFVVDEDLRFQEFHHADDLGFVYLAFACARRIAVIKDKFIHYRKNSGSSQADLVHLWPEGCYLALEQLKQAMEKKRIFENYRIAFAQMVMVYAAFYLDSMKSWEEFRALYEGLQGEWFDRLEQYAVPDEAFKLKFWTKLRSLIKDVSPSDYIFRQSRGLEPFRSEAGWKKKIAAGSSIGIYGAGRFGTEIFCEQMIKREYTIVAWADKNYKEIGYPVIAPEELHNTKMEALLVAIISESIYQSVRKDLIDLGIDENKIYWIGAANE